MSTTSISHSNDTGNGSGDIKTSKILKFKRKLSNSNSSSNTSNDNNNRDKDILNNNYNILNSNKDILNNNSDSKDDSDSENCDSYDLINKRCIHISSVCTNLIRSDDYNDLLNSISLSNEINDMVLDLKTIKYKIINCINMNILCVECMKFYNMNDYEIHISNKKIKKHYIYCKFNINNLDIELDLKCNECALVQIDTDYNINIMKNLIRQILLLDNDVETNVNSNAFTNDSILSLLQKEKMYDPDFEDISNTINNGIGLRNLGNTCYLNSSLQCLFHCPSFVNIMLQSKCFINGTFINRKNHKNYIHFEELYKSSLTFISHILSDPNMKITSISPSDIIRSIGKSLPYFKGYDQHDAQEFLSCLIDVYDEYLKCSSKGSTLNVLFGGTFSSNVACLECEYVSAKIDPFTMLSLELPSYNELNEIYKDYPELTIQSGYLGMFTNYLGISSYPIKLEACLRHFCAVEFLPAQYKCDKCKVKVDAEKGLSLRSLPEILLISFKRFATYPYSHKLDSYIQFPLTLDLAKYTDGVEIGNDSHESTYTCFGVITHVGSLYGGHYYCYIKYGNKWLCCNDSNVSEVSESTVLNSYAYILFYEREKSQTNVDFIINSLNDPSPYGSMCYISFRWLQRLFMLTDPGPIENGDLVCRHNSRFEEISGMMMPSSVYFQLQQKYGGGPYVPQNYSPCPGCLEADRLIEVERIYKLEKIGDESTLFVIDFQWLSKWNKFIEGGERPGPITNNHLCTKVDNINIPRKDIQLDVDYSLIKSSDWKFLYNIYGGGPAMFHRLKKDNDMDTDVN